MKTLSRKRISEIDGFRAIAILFVIFGHLGIKASPAQTGVLLFFVISGFVITKSVLNEIERTKRFSVKNFYGRRFYKIIPPLFFLIIIPTLLSGFWIHLSPRTVFSQIFFYYNWIKIKNGTDGALPGSSVIWSLSIEEQFYIVLALIIFLMKKNMQKSKHYLTFIYIAIFIYSTLSRLYVFHGLSKVDQLRDSARILFGTDTRISSIAIGGLVAVLAKNSRLDFSNRVLSKHVKILLFTLISFFGLFSFTYRDIYFRNTWKYSLQEGLCAVLIIATLNSQNLPKVLRRFLNSKLVQSIGVSSYAIYLSHLSIIYVLDSVLPTWVLHRFFIRIMVLTCISLVLGVFAYYLFDKSFESKRKSYR